jgi:hypothetical protein
VVGGVQVDAASSAQLPWKLRETGGGMWHVYRVLGRAVPRVALIVMRCCAIAAGTSVIEQRQFQEGCSSRCRAQLKVADCCGSHGALTRARAPRRGAPVGVADGSFW